MNPKRVTVIGGGPAGMMAAIAAAQAGACVTLCERQAQLGRKLAATGGGRCNLTNTLDVETFMSRFGTEGRFMTGALRRFGRDDLLRQMTEWGVPCAAADGFHYFPVSQRAMDVLQALERQLKKLNVQVRLSTVVSALDLVAGRVCGVVAAGARLPADAVILAAGGAAWPSLGGCGLGYDLAIQAGHEVVEPSPALVGLVTRETWPRLCAGVTLPDVMARIDLPECRKEVWRGVLLFTHAGLSGPLMLDISGPVTRLLRRQEQVPLRLSLFPDLSRETWNTRLAEWRTGRGKKSVRNLLDESLPQSLATAVCEACGIDSAVRASGMTAEARDRLLEWMTALPVTITGSGGMAQAMVTHGGVSLRDIHPATLESRRVSGLYVAGEVMDLDGPCGGYNLQWAFSSGWQAGALAQRGEG